MKKERLITRTIESTLCSIKCFDDKKGVVFDTEMEFSGVLKASEVRAAFEKAVGKNGLHFVLVNSIGTVEKLYGMPESLFIKFATVLPPRAKAEAQEEA